MRSDETSRSTDTPLIGRLETISAIAVVGLLGLVLGVVGLMTPSHKSAVGKTGYTQSGAFSYRGQAPANSVYGRAGVRSGDPIVVGTVQDLSFTFGYHLGSDAPVVAKGTESLVAQVKGAQGLSRTFVIGSAKHFTGQTVTGSGRFPMAAIRSFFSKTSAVVPNASLAGATVSVVARVNVAGTVGGRHLTTSFHPSLPFTMTGTTLTPSAPAGAAEIPGSSTPRQQLSSSRDGSIDFPTTVNKTVSLIVAHPPVGAVRIVGLTLFCLCLLLCIGFGRPLLRSGGVRHDRDRFRAMYGSMIVPIRSFDAARGPVADVVTMGSLAELAKRYEAMILHRRRDDGDDYMVWDNGILYRHTIGAPELDAPTSSGRFREPESGVVSQLEPLPAMPQVPTVPSSASNATLDESTLFTRDRPATGRRPSPLRRK